MGVFRHIILFTSRNSSRSSFMRPTKLTINILIIIGILGVILISYFLLKGDDSDFLNGNNDSSKETDGSVYPGVNIISEITEETTYNIAIHYPEFNDQTLNKKISEYISKSEEEFLSEVNKNKELLKEYPATLYISFEIHQFAKDTYSIVFNVESYVSGANGIQSSKVFLVDVNNNNFIQQTEILIDNEQNRNKIYELLLNEFEQSEHYNLYLFKDNLKKWVEDENNTFSNVFLTNELVVFKFDKYVVTAGAAGSPEISIPLIEIRDLITDEWKKRMDLKVDEVPELPEKPEPSDENDSDKDKDTPSSGKQVALTFDDGPHPTNTLEILELLEEYNAKATFFMLGNRVEFYPDIAKVIAEKGHELGNHTWSHKDLTSLGQEEMSEEVNITNEVIQNATGEQATVFRPPYGAINDQVREVLGIPSTLWTIDTMDWKSHDPNAVLSIVKENITDGSIILMHDIHETTVEAVELVLKFLDEEGYEFVTVSEINSD
jgi:peptidoglycan-N-acetylglucosamine deacetylase